MLPSGCIAEGVRICRCTLSTMTTVFVPKLLLSRAKQIADLPLRGISYLINDEDGAISRLYVGQTQQGTSRRGVCAWCVRGRHVRREGKTEEQCFNMFSSPQATATSRTVRSVLLSSDAACRIRRSLTYALKFLQSRDQKACSRTIG